MSEIQSGWDGPYFSAEHPESGGYLSASLFDVGWFYLAEVVVPNEFHKRGVGTALVERAFQQIQQEALPLPAERVYAHIISEGGYRLLAGYFGQEALRSRFADGSVQIGGEYNPRAFDIVLDYPL